VKILPESRSRKFVLCGLFVVLFVLLFLSYGWTFVAKFRYKPVAGDVLFQSLPNPMGVDIVDAIEGATNSPYSHCGVVLRKGDEWYVIEGMVPFVQEIPLFEWVQRSRGQMCVYRLKPELREKIPEWIAEMKKELGKPYDYQYKMEDDCVYCSELPFDAWKRLMDENMGTLVKLGDLDWTDYREVIEEIEGSSKIPEDREMITPRDLARAPQLQFVLSNGLKRECVDLAQP